MSQHTDRTGLYIMVFIILVTVLNIHDEVVRLRKNVEATNIVLTTEGAQ